MRKFEHGIAAFIDVETTGLNPARHEIVELAIVLFRYERHSGRITRIMDEYAGLREPVSGRIPPGAVAVHGITMDMVRGLRLDDDRILSLIGQAQFLVAHNAWFDYGFVTRLYPTAAQKPWLCSLRQIRWDRYGFRFRGLQKLLLAHGIVTRRAHRAADDCRAALALLNRRSPRGHRYFLDLLSCLPQPAVAAGLKSGKPS